jgi:hypothetical protein
METVQLDDSVDGRQQLVPPLHLKLLALKAPDTASSRVVLIKIVVPSALAVSLWKFIRAFKIDIQGQEGKFRP